MESTKEEKSFTESHYTDEMLDSDVYNDLYDKYIRCLSEYDNFRKRTLKEKEDLVNNGHSKTIEAFLPILDDFERALENVSEDSKSGVELIYNKFVSTLMFLGVKKINVENEVTEFDTDIHDAVLMTNVNDINLNKKIIGVVQNGYKLNGKIIRHPKVIVGNYNIN